MNNDIKEILDNLKKTADNIIFVICGSQEELDKAPKYTANFLSINDRQTKTLLDYITNLQEDLDYQKEMYLEYCDKHTKLIQKYSDLQEENERLNNELGALLIEKYGVSNLNIDKNGNFKGTIKTKEYYKSRIDKAKELKEGK